mmetsp:Transcript_112935/g.196058  ORF Transcript_112935/g.196058 Transcript_112935/m.196058 type:complete len:259 (-) Transcript_112935:36-812(-)
MQIVDPSYPRYMVQMTKGCHFPFHGCVTVSNPNPGQACILNEGYPYPCSGLSIVCSSSIEPQYHSSTDNGELLEASRNYFPRIPDGAMSSQPPTTPVIRCIVSRHPSQVPKDFLVFIDLVGAFFCEDGFYQPPPAANMRFKPTTAASVYPQSVCVTSMYKQPEHDLTPTPVSSNLDPFFNPRSSPHSITSDPGPKGRSDSFIPGAVKLHFSVCVRARTPLPLNKKKEDRSDEVIPKAPKCCVWQVRLLDLRGQPLASF